MKVHVRNLSAKIQSMPQKRTDVITLDISWVAIAKVLAVLGGLWAAFLLRDVLFMLFVVFIFVAAVNPTIKQLQKYMPRMWAVTTFYTALTLVVLLVGYLFLPNFVAQMEGLANDFPNFIQHLKPFLSNFPVLQDQSLIDNLISNVSGTLRSFGGNALSSIVSLFGGMILVLTGLVISFYLLLEEKNAREFFHQILPRNRYQAIYETIRKISSQLGAWIRGQLTIMLAVAVLNIVAYTVIGLPSPLPLGIWSGLCEVIPYVGPYLGVLPGLALAITSGSIVDVVYVAMINYFVIQQFQNFFITPRVMGKAVGLSPVLVIIAILTGITLFGVLGAVIALPCAAIISVVVGEWSNLKKLWNTLGDEASEADDGTSR